MEEFGISLSLKNEHLEEVKPRPQPAVLSMPSSNRQRARIHTSLIAGVWPNDALCDSLKNYKSLIRIEPTYFMWGDGRRGPCTGLIFFFSEAKEAIMFKLAYSGS